MGAEIFGGGMLGTAVTQSTVRTKERNFESRDVESGAAVRRSSNGGGLLWWNGHGMGDVIQNYRETKRGVLCKRSGDFDTTIGGEIDNMTSTSANELTVLASVIGIGSEKFNRNVSLECM